MDSQEASPGLLEASPGLLEPSLGLSEASPDLLEAIPGLSKASSGLSKVSSALAEASQRLPEAPDRPELASEKPEPASGKPQPASEEPRGGGRTYVRTDGRTYGRTYRFPLYSTGLRPLRFPPGPLPKKEGQVNAGPTEVGGGWDGGLGSRVPGDSRQMVAIFGARCDGPGHSARKVGFPVESPWLILWRPCRKVGSVLTGQPLGNPVFNLMCFFHILELEFHSGCTNDPAQNACFCL